MRKQVRKLRHWKQRFNKNAEFIFRRPVMYGNKIHKPGDPIPPELTDNPTKLRRFWESQTIELAEFEDPNVVTGQVDHHLPGGVTVVPGKGSWFTVTTSDIETKVNGQKALDTLLDKLRSEATEADRPPMLLGSSVLESTYDIEGETITLGEIVAITQENSGLTVDEWNTLVQDETEQAEALLAQSLRWMQDQGDDDEDWLNDGETVGN